MKNIYLIIALSSFSLNCHADWLDIVLDATSQLADELFPEDVQKSKKLLGDRLNTYPKHFKLQKVTEPIHNTDLFFLETGSLDKPPILLIHGLGDLATLDWLNVIPELEKHYHVYAFDLPGFGLSNHHYFEYSPKEYSKIMNWFIQNIMPHSSQKPILIGHSMGAAVSLYYASYYPNNIARLVLVSAAGILERTSYLKHLSELNLGGSQQNNLWLGFNRRINHFSAKWVEKTGEMYDPSKILSQNKALRKLMLARNTNLNAGLALIDTDFSLLNYDNLPPTVMIWGEDDPIAPIRTGRALLGKISQSTLTPIFAGGHVPMKSKAAEFNRQLLFLLKMNIEKKEDLKYFLDNFNKNTNQNRTAQCVNDDITRFEGHYESIILENCKKAMLKNVVSKRLFVNHSIASVENSIIGSVSSDIEIYSSRIKATSSQFLGSIKSKDSRLDFANVKIIANDFAIDSTRNSTVILSLSEIESPFFHGIAHGYFQLGKENIENRM